MTLPSLGTELDVVPVSLTYVRTLEFFEGDRLVELRTESNEPFLGMWFDASEGVTRWLYVRTTDVDLTKYVARAKSLREILLGARDGLFYLIDKHETGQFARVALLPSVDLPASSVPDDDSFFDCDLSPADAALTDEQAILVDGKWSGELLAFLERRYTQAYAFLAIAGGRFSTQRVQSAFERYRVRGGFIQHTIFSQLASLLPRELLPAMASVQISSPGVVRYNVDPELAARVRVALRRFQDRRDDAARAYNVLHDILIEMERSTKKSNSLRVIQLSAKLNEPMRNLAAVLGQIHLDSLLNATNNNQLNAAHLIAAYWRKLHELDQLELNERARIV
jgi:hypothetical protein